MAVAPSISLVAYEDRTGNFVFVKIPNERGRYLKTHRCVIYVHCPDTKCASIPGEPCKSTAVQSRSADGYHTSVHVSRARLFEARYGRKRRPHEEMVKIFQRYY